MMASPGTVGRDELVAYLRDLLDIDRSPDLCPNGLQVEGAARIDRLVTGVSACQELFERAVAVGAQAVLVHHGLFWRGDPRPVVGFRKRRLAELLAADVNLLAYHLPLDRHSELGNNVLAARGLGLEALVEFGSYEGAPIGWSGRFARPLAAAELAERCSTLFGQRPQLFGGADRPVSTLGVISGGAQREFHAAIAAGLDAFLTGEASEWVVNVARETGTLYVAAGHYATERLGVQALGEHLVERFGLSVEYVEVHNPV
jgi:dinuclear metal center YbgI/SA1388 family protein